MEQVSTFMHLRSLSIQVVKHLHSPGICAATSCSPWKHCEKCLKDVMNLLCLFQKCVSFRRIKWITPERGGMYFTTVPKI